MERLRFEALLAQASEAADPRAGLLYSYEDLQEILGKLVRAARRVADENTAMDQRLVRSAAPRITLKGTESSREGRIQSLIAARQGAAASPSGDLPPAPVHFQSP